MSLLWGLMNTLQMIVNHQLLQIVMPANVTLILEFISSLVELKLLKKVTNAITGDDEEVLSDSIQHLKQQSLMKNIETMLIVFVAVAVLVGIAGALWFLRKRYSW